MPMNLWNYEVEGGFDGTVVAFDAKAAAEAAWEELCNSDPEFYGGGDVEVWLNDGDVRQKFTVGVESVPLFTASPVKLSDKT